MMPKGGVHSKLRETSSIISVVTRLESADRPDSVAKTFSRASKSMMDPPNLHNRVFNDLRIIRYLHL